MNIKVKHNEGIVNAGANSQNVIMREPAHGLSNIDWNRLSGEIHALEKSADRSIRQFAAEAEDAVQNQDPGKVKKWLSKWMPCVGKLIETSYYIVEIAAKLGLGG